MDAGDGARPPRRPGQEAVRRDLGRAAPGPAAPRRGLPLIHEPDVALTDYALAIETGVFAVLLWRHPLPTPARRVGALVFACLALSSLTGGSYHGFFPDKTGSTGGWAAWILTMLVLGLAASLAWILFLVLAGVRDLRVPIPLVAAALLAYAYIVLRIDHGFRVSALFSAPPVLAILVLMLVRSIRDRQASARLAAAAIVLMLGAAVLQQLRVGLHPVWFNYNALYHLLEGIALGMLFVALRGAARELPGTP